MEQEPSIENLAFVEDLWQRYREDRASAPTHEAEIIASSKDGGNNG